MIDAIRRSIKMWFARRSIYNQTHRELSSLTQRELSDLGLNSAMISEVAYEAAYGGK
jgi:uncharacterized protein YjiS (DUF1127 family)